MSKLSDVWRKTFGFASRKPQPELSETPEPVAPSTIHPGLTDQQLVVLLTAAACEVVAAPVLIRKFRESPQRNWSWVAQGRMTLHTHRPR